MDFTFRQRLLALSMAVIFVLSGCSSGPEDAREDSDALTWGRWNGYDRFLELLDDTCPDIEIRQISYGGANRTGYSWAQMRADDIPDIFITSQILDEELAGERLADLSGYSFVNDLSTSVLDQVSIDGGIYLLPANYAMYGIVYNKTLMEEHGWEVPTDFAELEALCEEIRAEGLIPGIIGTQLTGNTFSAFFNLAKTSWLTTPEGVQWEQDFLAGKASAEETWKETLDYVQRYIDIGMFQTDPEDSGNPALLQHYLGERRCVFYTAAHIIDITEFADTGDQLGIMPYISEDGSKNIYMYSPSSYIGISRRLTEPGNEKKLEDAVRILSLFYSPEGQASFINEHTPSLMSVLGSAEIPESSLIYDARQALQQGRAFPMTYVRWENILTDIGQVFKEWVRGENGMDAAGCIARMDELVQSSLAQSDQVYFCESTADFTLEETGRLLAKALGSAAGADAAMVPLGESREGEPEFRMGVPGKLYKGRINMEIAATICPNVCEGCAVLTMTGAQARELMETGFDLKDGSRPYPYLLVTRDNAELEDDKTYQIAFWTDTYTEENAERFSARIVTGPFRSILENWLREQKTVSPDGNPWES